MEFNPFHEPTIKALIDHEIISTIYIWQCNGTCSWSETCKILQELLKLKHVMLLNPDTCFQDKQEWKATLSLHWKYFLMRKHLFP
jgi:hypothetical protein